MRRLILGLAAVAVTGCIHAGNKSMGGGLAYVMDSDHARYLCEESITAITPNARYVQDPHNEIGFEANSGIAADGTGIARLLGEPKCRAVKRLTLSGPDGAALRL
jgi:hypothetical protein